MSKGDFVSKKLRDFSRGQECAIRLPDICNCDDRTVVGCHVPTKYKGFGIKSPDLFIADGCSACHDVIDGRNNNHNFTKDELLVYVYQAMIESQMRRLRAGLIKLP